MFDRIWYKQIDNYRSRPEHITVYETSNRCCMLDWGVVHHRDFDKLNNNPLNLRGMMRSKHTEYHQCIEQFLKDVATRLLNESLKEIKSLQNNSYEYDKRLEKKTFVNPDLTKEELDDPKYYLIINSDRDDFILQNIMMEKLRDGIQDLTLHYHVDPDKKRLEVLI